MQEGLVKIDVAPVVRSAEKDENVEMVILIVCTVIIIFSSFSYLQNNQTVIAACVHFL